MKVKQTRAMRILSTGKSAPSEEENRLLHDICVWPDRPTQLNSAINPCNKLLPHFSDQNCQCVQLEAKPSN